MSPTTIPGNLILQSQSSNDPLLDLNTQPSLDLQFATSKTLDDRVSGLPLVDLQRDVSSGKSAGTYVDSTGVIRTSKVNLNTYSEDATVWDYNLVTAPTAPTSDVISPAGLQSSFKLLETTNTGEHYFRLANTVVTSGSIYTQSIYIKPTLGRTKIRVYNFAQNNLVFIWDLVNNLEVSAAGGTSYSASSTAVGDGWYRFVFTDEATSVNFRSSFMTVTDSNQFNFAGDTTKGFYVTGAQLEEGSTASPYIKTTNLPSAAPRFDHDPTTNASLGLLVEESRTNEIPYSEDFTTWGLFDTGDTLTSSALTSPDGTLTGTLFAPDNTSGLHIVRQSYTFQGGTTYTLSVFVKEGGRRYMHLAAGGSALGFPSYDYRRGIFDLQTGSVNSTPLNGSADIKPFANGWYRCSITITPPAGGAANFDLYHADTTTPTINTVTDGNGTDGIYIWGAQLEAGAFPTSYIPTSGSTVPRAADNVSITGSNFSRWYSQSEGSTLINYNAPNAIIDTDYPRLFAFNSGFATDFSAFAFNGVNNSMFVNYVTGSSTKLSVSTTLPKNSNGTAALAYQDNNSIAFLNENSSTQGRTVGPMSTILNRLDIGGDSEFSSRMLNGTIARLTYYPYRLPDSTLQTITS